MRTTYDLDPELVRDVLRRTGEKSASRAIHKALTEFIRRQKVEELRKLLGTMDLEDNWREMEERELEGYAAKRAMILVDTSVWVRSLRREGSREREELATLLSLDEVAITDVVMAEVLQGARSEEDFQELISKLDGPHYYYADTGVWFNAARLSFDLKRRGLITALSDLVIAAVALKNDLEVYAIDSDFARVPGLRLHEVT